MAGFAACGGNDSQPHTAGGAGAVATGGSSSGTAQGGTTQAGAAQAGTTQAGTTPAGVGQAGIAGMSAAGGGGSAGKAASGNAGVDAAAGGAAETGNGGAGGGTAGAPGLGGGNGGLPGTVPGQAGRAGNTSSTTGASGGSQGGAGTGGSTQAPLPTTWIPVSDFKSTKSGIPHGRVEVTTYDNTVLNKTGNNGRKASVYLPPAYDAAKKYPVLYALHGIGGDHREWVATDSNPQQVLDNLYAANKIVPMIVVFPNGRAMNPDTPPSDLYGATNSLAFNEFWTKDFEPFLIPHIEKTYPVHTDKAHRALLGYSMGGMQALQFGLGNPDTFTYVGALAPAPAGLGHPDVSKMDAAAVNANYRRLFISAGTSDSLYPAAQNFHDALTARGIDHIWVSVQSGAHNGTTWAPGLYNFAQIIFR